jgi:probable rRNA maturation factor
MNQFLVEIESEVDVDEQLASELMSVAVTTLIYEGVDEPAELTILMTSDERIRELNRQFLGEDKVTDVLSFPAGDPMPGAENYIGDIVISVPTAVLQAHAAGHSITDEMSLLTVHSILHLLGFDHSDAGEKLTMWSRQNKILAKLGVSPIEESRFS